MYKSGLTDLEAVAAVARRGNFRAAAADVGMSTSALSHAVAGLEARLGVRLFNRTTRSVSLTAAGGRSSSPPSARPWPTSARRWRRLAAIATPRRACCASTPRSGPPPGCCSRSCSNTCAAIRRCSSTLVTEGRLIDIVLEGFDAGVRIAEAVPADMIAVPMGPPISPAVVGSADYFADRPLPRVPRRPDGAPLHPGADGQRRDLSLGIRAAGRGRGRRRARPPDPGRAGPDAGRGPGRGRAWPI